ncbi:MAG: hypothetical protein A2Y25_08880 [Candidatus Melainabacteria bacterium GWF2_37_15]|nr:MAG: hypothetical protein A2Y25_08880 [Candidatus Melainabacteria bacterium GWF2_37_15]
MEKTIEYYQTKNGKCPFEEWIKSFKDKTTKMRILKRIERLEYGYYGEFEQINEDLFELKLKFGKGYRIYYSDINNKLVLFLSGGDKHRQSADIKKAIEYLNDYKERIK